MYPVLFRIGDFEITSFGVMVALGALVGLWLLRRELVRSGLPADAADIGAWGLLGGLAGAKLLWVMEHSGEEPFLDLLLSRGGLSWYGGLIGGVGVGLGVMVRHHLPLVPVLAAATPALAFGHLLGRIGCFLVGDDYGRPTSLPWGIAFPEGLPPTDTPVHPTQFYEAAFLGGLGCLLLRWRKRRAPDALVLGRYLALTGTARFLIEFVRINERVALGLTLAQLVSLGLIVLGVIVMARGRPRG
jgi:phosphatidylglycerol:prolipoprotein diacylglycerol transferase